MELMQPSLQTYMKLHLLLCKIHIVFLKINQCGVFVQVSQKILFCCSDNVSSRIMVAII